MPSLTATRDTYTRVTTDNENTVANIVLDVKGITVPRKLGVSLAFLSDFNAGNPQWIDVPYIDISGDGMVIPFSNYLRGNKGDILVWATLRDPKTLEREYEIQWQLSGASVAVIKEITLKSELPAEKPTLPPGAPTLPFPPETLLPPGAPGTKEKLASDSPILASLFGWLEKQAELIAHKLDVTDELKDILEKKVLARVKPNMSNDEAAKAAIDVALDVLAGSVTLMTAASMIDATHPIKEWGAGKLAAAGLGIIGVNHFVTPILQNPYDTGILKPYRRYINSLYMTEDAKLSEAILFEQRQLYERENVLPVSEEFKKDAASDNYSPTLAAKIYSASLTLPSRIEMRQLVAAGKINRKGVLEILVLKGYHPAWIDTLADAYFMTKVKDAKLSLSQLETAFRHGVITKDEQKKYLALYGYDEREIEIIEATQQVEISEAATKATEAAAKKKEAAEKKHEAAAEKEKAHLSVTSSPSQASIFLDDVFTYRITPETLELEDGKKYIVSVVKEGYAAQTFEVEGKKGEKAELHVDLKKS